MDRNSSKSGNKILIGMIFLAVGGLFLGAVIGYFGTNAYLNNKVLSDMKNEGYVLTGDATARPEDIVAGKTAFVNGQMITGTKDVLNTSDATASSATILRGKTAYVNGELVVGTLDTIQEEKIRPSTTVTYVEGYGYLARDLIIEGDADLTADKIRKGETIFGVVGTYDATPVNYLITYQNVTTNENHPDNPYAYRSNFSTDIVLKSATREGYDFAGWSPSDTIKVGTTGNLTFTASWTPKTYKITYNLSGGTNNSANPATYTIESPTITLLAPVRDGYTFVSWSEGNTITSGSMGDRTFTAQWEKIPEPEPEPEPPVEEESGQEEQ